MNLSGKIKLLRNKAHLSQSQLAEQMDVTHQVVHQWETGESVPSLECIVKLSDVLEVSLDNLLKNPLTSFQTQSFALPTVQAQGSELPKIQKSVDKVQKNVEQKREEQKSMGLGDLAYLLSFVAYLVIGFVWGLWHPGWLLFFLAASIDELTNAANTDKKQADFYGTASLIFFVMGFFFELWHFAWLAFLFAAIIEASVASQNL